MRLPWKYLIVAAVILIHVVVILLLFHPNTTDSNTLPAQPGKSAAAVANGAKDASPHPAAPLGTAAEPKKNDGGAADSSANPPLIRPPTMAQPIQRGAMPGNYYPGFYHTDLKPLPPSLQRMVGACRSGVAIDVSTHSILWQKAATQTYPIASLSKIMTSQMLLDRIANDPQTTLQTKIAVTKEDFQITRKIHGVYLNQGEALTLQEYLKCMIIASANDCAYMVGKFLGNGNLATFVQQMNDHAKELGVSDMRFYNPHGLPIEGKGARVENLGSALDIAYLSERATHYPEIMRWAGTKSDCIREDSKRFDLNSTNKLLRGRVAGITGIKTGYTATAGYCITVTCERNDRPVIVVLMGVMGSDFGKTRDKIATALIEWAYK